jgi:hypothetical protein
MTEFITLPSSVDNGALEWLDPYAVKRIATDGFKRCRVYGFGFETGVSIDLPAGEVQRRVVEARTGGRVAPAPEPHPFPHPRRPASVGGILG